MSTFNTNSPLEAVMAIEAKTAEVFETLALTPAGIQGAVQERLYDLVAHHRLSTLKHHKLPGGVRATRMLATRLFAFAKPAASGFGVEAETFAAAVSGQTFGDSAIEQLERGGVITSSKPMAIPSGQGAKAGRNGGIVATERFKRQLGQRGFDVSKSGTLFDTAASGKGGGLRNELFGQLRKRRNQRALLGWNAAFNSVVTRQLALMDEDIEKGMDAAGASVIAGRTTTAIATRSAYDNALKRELAQYGSAPITKPQMAKARVVARNAARTVRKLRGGRA